MDIYATSCIYTDVRHKQNNMENKEIGIKSIMVRKLFGHYDYDLPKDTDEKDLNKLFILYGDNGSGKTTVLNLIFYLLSTKNKSGFKSRLAQTKFEKFSILLTNGVEIGAKRERSVYGSYTYYVKKNSKIINQIHLKTYDGHSISLDDGTDDDIKFNSILKYINDLNISIYFLSEDRKTLNSTVSTDFGDDFELTNSHIELSRKYERIIAKKSLNEKRLSLELTVERFIDWIRKQVIQSSKTGESNNVNIYSDLIKSINKPTEKLPSLAVLIKELSSLEKESSKLSKVGLIAPTDFIELKESISSIKTNEESLPRILHLFISSTKARFSALEKLYETIDDFISSINSFYTNKSLSFNLSQGFEIKHNSGDELKLEMLSSGEKQLLLLFINTITATDQATIFIIDEPEISLNIKWQRNLLKTLLKFSSDNYVQFIIATHSIELLAPNTKNVTKLEE
jgi:predicted ATPase